MKVINSDGEVVSPGDNLTSFRGEVWIFISATNRGKIYAQKLGSDWKQELNPSVFAVTIQQA